MSADFALELLTCWSLHVLHFWLPPSFKKELQLFQTMMRTSMWMRMLTAPATGTMGKAHKGGQVHKPGPVGQGRGAEGQDQQAAGGRGEQPAGNLQQRYQLPAADLG